MNVPNIAELPTEYDAYGEAILPDAPQVTLGNGEKAVPQQFSHYQRNVKNVENILSKITFCKKYILFAFEEGGNIFIQVGIIGHENYPINRHGNKQKNKIVYGRKWLIEAYTPTSEVIQTAYLAINKVREHELREHLTVSFYQKEKQYKATPFNTHIDLPLAAKHKSLFYQKETKGTSLNRKAQVTRWLKNWKIGNFSFTVEKTYMIDQQHWLTGLILQSNHITKENYNNDIIVRYFPELLDGVIYLVTSQNDSISLFYELMNSLIGKAEKFVANQFAYDGFTRFSHNLAPQCFAKFSVDTRVIKKQKTKKFRAAFSTMADLVDSSKAPPLAQSPKLSKMQQQSITEYQELEGYLPKQLNKI